MHGKDYELLASALDGLNYPERIKVFRHLVGPLTEDNPRFDPHKFGDSLGIPERVRLLFPGVKNKEEVGNASST